MAFTDFIDMVEDKFGLEVADQMIQSCDLPSGGGAYTSVGTYDHSEMVQLVVRLSALSGLTLPDLLRVFGEHLFTRFAVRYPEFFEGVTNAFIFLEGIESNIHTEVRKLYPDAELPSFECFLEGQDKLVMDYRSNRGMADLAAGLIRGAAAHFNEKLVINRDDFSNGNGTNVRFSVSHQ